LGIKKEEGERKRNPQEGEQIMHEGPIFEMLKRVREKDAKRKAAINEEEQRPTKLRCEREERIAVVQLKAYWECFPLPVKQTRAGDAHADETSEDELIEDSGQDSWCNSEPGPIRGSDQELIIAKAKRSTQREQETAHLQRSSDKEEEGMRNWM